MTGSAVAVMTGSEGAASGGRGRSGAVLLRVSIAVFVHFFGLGLSLAVLPLYVHDVLHMSPLTVGSVGGAQFAAALLTRAWAGAIADTRGPKRSVAFGIVAACAAGALYGVSLAVASWPLAAVAFLLVARALLGCSESLVVTGALTWGLGAVGVGRAGQVISWTGIAMFASYALGAPLGTAVYAVLGFAGIAAATALAPIGAWVALAGLRPAAAPAGSARTPFYKVLRAVWLPGLGLTFSAVGFGVITTFIALLFGAGGWDHAALAITSFGAAFIIARLFFGRWPDRFGGARIALVCATIEVVGQALIWRADAPMLAYIGAALTGFGYSLVFPSFGVEAVRRSPPQSRGAAMGAYVAFLDLSLGLSGPVTGALASGWGVRSVYLAGALCAVASASIALGLMKQKT